MAQFSNLLIYKIFLKQTTQKINMSKKYINTENLSISENFFINLLMMRLFPEQKLKKKNFGKD